MKIRFFICLVVLFAAATCFAGSPMTVRSGKFYKWKDGVINVWFDPGPLSNNTSNSEAKKIVKEAWTVWENAKLLPDNLAADNGGYVTVSGVKFVDKGNITSVDDIDETNYHDYFLGDPDKGDGAYDPDRPTVVIFDKNGKIMADLVDRGIISTEDVLGMANIYALDENSPYIINGTIIINGLMWEASSDKNTFKAAFLHELGHLINLDHSAINDDCLQDDNCAGDLVGNQYLPSMFRYPRSFHQYTLHKDDTVWSALLYSNENPKLKEEFCTVTGKIVDKKGRGVQGAHIRAVEDGSSKEVRTTAISAISGAFSSVCSVDGAYILMGLRPNKKYKIIYGTIPDWCGDYASGSCSLVSGINPYAPPRKISSGNIAHGDSVEFECGEGGKVMEADTVTLLDVDLDDAKYRQYDNLKAEGMECEAGKTGMTVIPPPEKKTPAGLSIKKGWCSLIPGASSSLTFLWFFLPALILAVFRPRR